MKYHLLIFISVLFLSKASIVPFNKQILAEIYQQSKGRSTQARCISFTFMTTITIFQLNRFSIRTALEKNYAQHWKYMICYQAN